MVRHRAVPLARRVNLSLRHLRLRHLLVDLRRRHPRLLQVVDELLVVEDVALHLIELTQNGALDVLELRLH